MNEEFPEIKTWLLSCSYPLTYKKKAFLTLNSRDLHLEKEEVVILFSLTHYKGKIHALNSSSSLSKPNYVRPHSDPNCRKHILPKVK